MLLFFFFCCCCFFFALVVKAIKEVQAKLLCYNVTRVGGFSFVSCCFFETLTLALQSFPHRRKKKKNLCLVIHNSLNFIYYLGGTCRLSSFEEKVEQQKCLQRQGDAFFFNESNQTCHVYSNCEFRLDSQVQYSFFFFSLFLSFHFCMFFNQMDTKEKQMSFDNYAYFLEFVVLVFFFHPTGMFQSKKNRSAPPTFLPQNLQRPQFTLT